MNRFMGLICLLTCASMSSGNVMLRGRNFTLSFDDIEANFAPSVEGSGVSGMLHLASPMDACSVLDNMIDRITNRSSRFLLIVRGGCSFQTKVQRAQKAGYKAAIIYDNEDDGLLVSMAGNAVDIKINAVFVSKASGEMLLKYAGFVNMDVWIFPNFENSAWSIIAISFISLLAISAVVATCFFVRRHHTRQERPQASRARKFHGMSSRSVKAMPSLIFTAILEDNCTSMTCAICLEDYSVGEKLRILPCRHKFHASCVDSWLTTWRTFCPICKHDARSNTDDPPASETTPLLSPTTDSRSSSSGSHIHSMSVSRSSVYLRNGSSERPRASYLISPLNPRYMPPYN